MNAIVASVRRAFTEACAAVQNGCMKSREVLPHFRKFTCVSVLMIRMLTRDKQLVLFRGVYLAARKRRIGFVTLYRLFCSRLTKSV